MKPNTAQHLHVKSYTEALLKQWGSISAAAKHAGVDYMTLRYWMRKHGIEWGEKKQETTLREDIDKEKEQILKGRHLHKFNELRKQKALNELVIDTLRECIQPLNLDFNFLPASLDESGETESLVLVISDTQIGKVTPDYNVEQFGRRLRSCAQTVGKLTLIHQQHYKIPECVVMFAGDIVDGECIYPGHAFGIEQSVMQQVFQSGVPEFVSFFWYLSQFFERIRVVCVPGNHGRNGRHAATETNWDRVFYEALRLSLQNIKSISWEIADLQQFYVTTEINGHTFLVVHGDEIPIWMNIPYYGIERSSSRWAQSIPRGPWEYLVMGHFHQSAWLKSNAKKIIMNGAFPTDDPWVLKRLKLDTTEAVQWCFGVHKRGISWRYEIDLLKEAV